MTEHKKGCVNHIQRVQKSLGNSSIQCLMSFYGCIMSQSPHTNK